MDKTEDLERKLIELIKQKSKEVSKKEELEKAEELAKQKLLDKLRPYFGDEAESILEYLDDYIDTIAIALETKRFKIVADAIEDLFYLTDGKFMDELIYSISLEAAKYPERTMLRYYSTIMNKLSELKEHFPEAVEKSMMALRNALRITDEASKIKQNILRRLVEE